MKNKKEKKKSRYLATVGGQALMEGIMMNGPKGAAMALRMPDGSIEVTPKTMKRLKDKNKFWGLPLIRGPVNFVESMIFGYNCLMESAEKTSIDLDSGEEEMSKLDKWITDHFGKKMMAVLGAVSAVLGFLLSFALFIYLPALFFDKVLVRFTGIDVMWRPLVEGIIKVMIFVVYMASISLMKEMRRLFMYHGAEHKSIFCLEAGEELTVENVRKQKRFHPRCGTSFIFVMIILSILIASIVSVVFAGTAITKVRALWVAVKLLILPIVMSLGYEFIKYAGTHDNVCVTILAAPGLWMQRITTREPTDDIIEVGIASLKAVIDDDKPSEPSAEETPDEPETSVQETPAEAKEENEP
ncbi:MAG: DUF1385 domain-containing protein [Clostridiales bacterium]|nr:DUF1385 domain-containing protein [Clostridiales bacterium]